MIFTLIFFIYCENETKIKKAEREKAENEYFEWWSTNPNPEILVLLSFKYDIEINKLEKILREYIKSEYNPDILRFETKEELEGIKDDIQDVIIKLSSEYDISKEFLSSLIIKYLELDVITLDY